MKTRRGMTLLLVLLSLVLVAAVVVPLASLAATEALVTAHRGAALQHRLAGDSAITLLPGLLTDRDVQRQLERDNRAELEWQAGPVQVSLRIQDDSAKLPLPLVAGLPVAARGAALDRLAVLAGLSAAEPAASARWAGCIEDLFEAPTEAALFGRGDRPGWIDWVTPLAGPVNLRRASIAVLEALLLDIRPGLGDELAARDAEAQRDLLAGLPPAEARRAGERLGGDTRRWSLLIRTAIGPEARRRYVICSAAAQPEVLLDWEVAP